MAMFDGTLFTSEYRPCVVNGRNALFHRWEDKSNIHNAMLIGETSGQIKYTVAIIEYEDGVVTECYPHEIRFCDNKCKNYAFEEVSK